MSKEKHKVMTAMFDIKPVDNSGNIDVSKIYEIQTVVNLGRKFRVTKGGIKFQSQKLKSRINSKTQTVKNLMFKIIIRIIEFYFSQIGRSRGQHNQTENG